ncbi:hypothetical protein LMH87_001640 [Akanthomyces muscarius]|uniref:BZIP domain-containing protein n=1 Tax=Akanthomyces muscarius TaxID=2231603 RepID=A0A9W8Q4P6_AKAMU|nr:hypothetical protein LMH87_001640 [Akanthomyces muscarius]KAJ4147092.1 hypothetical protein LMH87_001640 [Akanthomyces muscarius]
MDPEHGATRVPTPDLNTLADLNGGSTSPTSTNSSLVCLGTPSSTDTTTPLLAVTAESISFEEQRKIRKRENNRMAQRKYRLNQKAKMLELELSFAEMAATTNSTGYHSATAMHLIALSEMTEPETESGRQAQLARQMHDDHYIDYA